jgi:hydroxypyruvate reductase
MNARENAIKIFSAAVAAVQPAQLIPAHLFIEQGMLHIFNQRFLVNGLPNIYVVGAGKASAAMAKTVEDILGNVITAGIVVAKYGHRLPLRKIICREAAHPLPDQNGVGATAETIALLQQARENDIVICLISGGASSLWIDTPLPATLADVQETFELLLRSGAAINEMNTVRKHLSAIKGGQLLQYAPKAKWFSFIISDVPGDDLSTIASGPTVADDTTFSDTDAILKKYELHNQLPASILQHIGDGIKGTMNDTPKRGDEILRISRHKIIGSNAIAVEAARVKAMKLGYTIAQVNKNLMGDACTVGRELVGECINYRGTKPACFLLGGETTVTVTGSGVGGRNQHMALSALMQMAIHEHAINKITFLAAGTDGTDGPTDATGAIADGETIFMAIENNLAAREYLENNDAYHFFEQTGSLLKTGATQTNVMDIVVGIIE